MRNSLKGCDLGRIEVITSDGNKSTEVADLIAVIRSTEDCPNKTVVVLFISLRFHLMTPEKKTELEARAAKTVVIL